MKKFLLSIFAVMLTVFSVQAEEVSGKITFKTSGSDSSSAATVDNFVSGQVTDNGGFTLSCTATNNCYTGKSGLKMSSGSKNGSFTLGLGSTYNVKTIIVEERTNDLVLQLPRNSIEVLIIMLTGKIYQITKNILLKFTLWTA